MSPKNLIPVVLFALLSATQAFARLPEAAWAPVPVSVSGTLAPFSLAIEGQAVPGVSAQKRDAVRINGEECTGVSSFFISTDADAVEWDGPAGGRVELPTLRKLKPNLWAMDLEVDPKTRQITWNGVEYAVENRRVEVPMSWDEVEMERTFVLELRTEAESPGRLYNVRFRNAPDTEHRLSIGPAGSVIGDGTALGYTVIRDGFWVVGFDYRWSTYSSTDYNHSYWEKSQAIEIRGGVRPFLAESKRLWDWRRWEVGMAVQRAWATAHSEMTNPPPEYSSDGTKTTNYLFGSVYQRLEALRWRRLGAEFEFKIAVWKRPDHHNVWGGLYLTYHL